VTDAPLALQLKFVSGSTVLSFYAPAAFIDKNSPNVSGTDILQQALSFKLLDDGTNGTLQAVYTSTDSTI
jgi:hypothetical protein